MCNTEIYESKNGIIDIVIKSSVYQLFQLIYNQKINFWMAPNLSNLLFNVLTLFALITKAVLTKVIKVSNNENLTGPA